MASPNSSLKILEVCKVAPPPSSHKSSFPLTFFDLLWLRLHPVERLFFFPVPHLNSSSFFHSIVPKLKRSLSLVLYHFLPLAGNIVWPSDDSLKPIAQYSPGDAVSLTIAVSDSDMTNLIDNSPREAVQCRPFIPNLESRDSSASALSLQITLFPNSGFCIGMSSHHACLDGKSSSMFIKAWAYLCRMTEADDAESESSSSGLLPPELQPFLDREVILDPRGLAVAYINGWSGLDPTGQTQKNRPSLKILSDMFPLIVDDSARAIFELKRGDLNKIKERVLQKWEINHKATEEEREDSSSSLSKPPTLSAFVLTASYVLVCIAKAIERTCENKTRKLLFCFPADCRSRLEPPIPENYFGNCVMPNIIETREEDFTDDGDGVVIVAKKIHTKIRKIQRERGALEGAETLFCRYSLESGEEIEIQYIAVAGSNRFGVYETDFGWGRPEKVEITSVDKNITMALAESKDGNGGVEVGLVLKKNVMDRFASLFQTEMESI
ncbi:malonyl-CoA:anthocyanidin 5-O-glucoside-6''-O-malonyltransferase-like [Prosopis cineraria]|uniref:malonyl-CoA:anthocyanidin 5-O-glucoside-6''-O-malonyltransferase-like n=1 Tax=Prosopis cineraria TaxID=364024 RepID=UPI00241043FE|nr:malonyl-CoA:anthocyanidin 5-O-glucoside-6''-O-malonyltransferase-like [Prosopis cineraria]